MNEQYIDTIHRYLAGTLPPPERDTFERQMAENPELQEDVALERLLLAGIGHAGETALRQQVSAVHEGLKAENFFAENKRPALRRSIVYRSAAIAAGLALVLAGIWFFRVSGSTDRLFARYFKPEQEVEQAREIIASLESFGLAAPATESDSLREALRFFEKNDYPAALRLLKPLAKAHPSNDTAEYYLGLACLQAEQYDEAVRQFQPLATDDTSAFRKEAQWYLGLSYLKLPGQQDKALEIFTRLAQDGDFSRQAEASALVKAVK